MGRIHVGQLRCFKRSDEMFIVVKVEQLVSSLKRVDIMMDDRVIRDWDYHYLLSASTLLPA